MPYVRVLKKKKNNNIKTHTHTQTFLKLATGGAPFVPTTIKLEMKATTSTKYSSVESKKMNQWEKISLNVKDNLVHMACGCTHAHSHALYGFIYTVLLSRAAVLPVPKHQNSQHASCSPAALNTWLRFLLIAVNENADTEHCFGKWSNIQTQ